MSTNFAPDGFLSFFGETGAPTAVTLDLQLTETSIHTREDYDGVHSRVNFEGATSEDNTGIVSDFLMDSKANHALSMEKIKENARIQREAEEAAKTQSGIYGGN